MISKKIFFTGGNGFIGKEVIPLLRKDGYEVVAPKSSELNLIDNNLVRQYFDVNGFKYDAIIHAAVLGGRRITQDGLITYLDNMRMFENIFAYSKYVDRFINIDSGASLFDSGEIPLDPYGFSKYCAARSVKNVENGINLKLFGCFGIHEDDHRFITTAIKNYINKEPITILQDKLMDFIYVKDFYKILKYSLECGPYLIQARPDMLHCTYDRKFYLSDIAEMINDLDRYDVPIIVKSKENGMPYCGKFSIDLDYIGLDQGIQEIYESLC